MRSIVFFMAILMLAGYCTAIRCYKGSDTAVYTTSNNFYSYCATAYVPCTQSLVTCTSAETSAGLSKWAYFFTSLAGADYPNMTLCSTDLCNKPTAISGGFWCYGGYGHSKENYEYSYVLYSSGRYCSSYGKVCDISSNGCTQELINAKHVMSYAEVATESDCSYYPYDTAYLNYTCCKGDFCAKPFPLRCKYGVSNATGYPLGVIDAPFDDTTYACISYTEPCNSTNCESGFERIYHGYSAAATCLYQRAPATNVLCCNSKECNTALQCYVGMNSKSAVLVTHLVDGYPLYCTTSSRNCSIVKEGCSSSEISLGTTKSYYAYVPGLRRQYDYCATDGCNAPASLLCYNTSNVFNQSQPDSKKTIEKYDSTDNCARFSYDCSNSLSKKYCTTTEISKGTIKTVYGSATDSECQLAQKDYMNILDPYCCKTALCNSYAAVKSSLSCYSGDYASGQSIAKTSYIKLPSAGSYSCYSKTYTCASVTSYCTQDNVNNKVARVEYGVTLSCGSVTCCSSNLCNRLSVNPLVEATTSTNTPSSNGTSTNPGVSNKLSSATTVTLSLSSLIAVIYLFIQ